MDDQPEYDVPQLRLELAVVIYNVLFDGGMAITRDDAYELAAGLLADALTRMAVDHLIEQSSLGTPEAHRLRRQTPDEVRDEIVGRVLEEQRRPPPAPRGATFAEHIIAIEQARE